MKNKGFTLIELLAVIVILAIIALIATPIVMNIIEDSKKGASERSAESYIKQVATEVASSYSNPTNKIKDGVYYIQVDESGNPTGKITDNYKEYDIDMSGTKPTEGTLYIKNGQVMNGSYLKINNNIVNYVDGKGEIKADYATKTIGTKIYYDPVSANKCTTGDTCYEWYVLVDKGADYAGVSLIMNRNLGDKVAWCDSSTCHWNNAIGPITATDALNERTRNWTIAARLITYEEANKVYVDNDNSMPSWMLENLQLTYSDSPLFPYHYWTSTKYSTNSIPAYVVGYDASIYSQTHIMAVGITTDTDSGVRPVITVLKSKIQ